MKAVEITPPQPRFLGDLSWVRVADADAFLEALRAAAPPSDVEPEKWLRLGYLAGALRHVAEANEAAAPAPRPDR